MLNNNKKKLLQELLKISLSQIQFLLEKGSFLMAKKDHFKFWYF